MIFYIIPGKLNSKDANIFSNLGWSYEFYIPNSFILDLHKAGIIEQFQVTVDFLKNISYCEN